MPIKIAINGFGRIGRNILRAVYESHFSKDFEVVAINDLTDLKTNAHLFKYDSVHGQFSGAVSTEGSDLVVNGNKIKVCAERDPSKLPWGNLNIDVVLECTGLFTERNKAEIHLKSGAKKILISAPAGKDVDATIVYGVNHNTLKPEHTVVSNGSCTTNCIAPLAKVIHDSFKIKRGLMVTVHAYTNDQRLTDSAHNDLRRARAAALSMIPSKTGAASAIGLVIPELSGKLDGYAVRVPVPNVSLIDLTVELEKPATAEEINVVMRQASQGNLKGVLDYTDEQLVSIDYNHCPASATFDSTQTRVIDKTLAKVIAWYDNEWGFSNRMLDVARLMGSNSR
ncbi:MAG: type I glyceraldehyde-3-phosphate dehydrogenase [Proteobacteria bacterium]|nr:type I glyceraldehyde-3-phosphate dehydrogenase [Pseudomonadota bacterium]